jgi:hypothetical protein
MSGRQAARCRVADMEQDFFPWKIQRVVLAKNAPKYNAYFLPLTFSKVLLAHKARLFRSKALRRYRQKVVGVVGSSSRVGQAAQAAGSMALPGNLSAARSPVRSGVARALTPGGGGVKPNLPSVDSRTYRCSEGFQFGGRFTDENYTTCGRMLFDVPASLENLAQAIFRTRDRRRGAGWSAETRRGEDIEGEGLGEAESPVTVKRAAQIPDTGDANEEGFNASLQQAIESIENQDADSGVLVRRDGFIMVPVVSLEDLRNVPDNRNMEEATYVKSVRSPEGLGGDEFGLLSNTGVNQLVYVTPAGVTISVQRQRELETGERRQLGKDANTAAEMDVSKDPLARINYIIENSDGAFEMNIDYGDVESPDEMTKDSEGNEIPKWAFESFIEAPEERQEEMVDLEAAEGTAPEAATPDGAIAAPEGEQAAPLKRVAVEPEERIESLSQAVEHLENGGLVSAIDPSIVMDALRRSKEYSSEKLKNGITLFTGPDGRRLILKENNRDFEHLSAHYSSELLREMGVHAPAVRFAGSGDDRPFYYRSPDDVIEGVESVDDYDSEEVAPEQIMGTQIADWLSDTRGRTDTSLFVGKAGEDAELIAAVGPASALIGLDADELEQRRNAVLADFMQETTDAYGTTFEDEPDETKAMMVTILDQLISRAQEFSWGDYKSKLALDGALSQAESSHLDAVQQIFENRLQQLLESRSVFLQILGLG